MRVPAWLDSTLVALFSVSVLTSKAGIYISSSLLLLRFFLFFIEGKLSKREFYNTPLLWVPFAIFFIGSFSTVLSNGLYIDFLEFVRKCALILVIPSLAIIFRSIVNQKIAIFFLIMTFSICALNVAFKVYQLGWNGRVSSFFDVGRWGELITYMIALFIPFFTCHKKNKRLAGTIVLVLGLMMILATGSRAPIIALSIIIPLFLFYKNRKALINFSVIFTTILLCLGIVSPKYLETVSERVVSIVDSSEDWSNLARLSMWNESGKFLISNFSSSKKDFLIGTGVVSFEEKYKEHLKKYNNLDFYSTNTNGQFSFNDSHNMYLDMMNKNGVIFFILWIGLFIAITYNLLSLHSKRTELDDGLLLVLACFAIIGMFYTSHMSYQTSFVYLSIALAMSNHEVKKNEI